MTRDEIQAEFDEFIEYPGKDKTYVTTVSTLLFAEHIARMARAQGLREAREVCEKEAESFGGVAAGPFATDFGKHTHNAMAAGAKNCAAAIKQLEGK